MSMRLIFNRNVSADYFDRRLDEIYPKYYQRGDVIDVSSVEHDGNFLIVSLESGDTLMSVPNGSLDHTIDY